MTMALNIAVIIAATVISGIAFLQLRWMLEAWMNPSSDDEVLVDLRDPQHRISLLLPARHEEQVLGATIDRLAASSHPNFEILVIIGHDDEDTRREADNAASRHPDVVRVIEDHSWPKNKPKALNTALELVTGDIVGVIDAEDDVAVDLLVEVDRAFSRTGAGIVQGAVQLMNYRADWMALRNCVEYYVHFNSRLRYFARVGFVPLGGNTVFVRTDLLNEVGGWDDECLAEDCELGVRLSTAGVRTTLVAVPELATREEAPTDIGVFLKQRTRWHQGFMQVYRKGVWRELDGIKSRLLARAVLSMPFAQVLPLILTPLVLISLWSDVPLAIAMISYVPLAAFLVTLVVEVVALREFGRDFDVPIGFIDVFRLLVGSLAYALVLTVASCRAALREIRDQRDWEKTDHVGAHRTQIDAVHTHVIDLAESAAVTQ